MANLAIIPARGGSKRIPRKNIRFFFDKPIIAYSIETALKSGLFDEVMVSTDDEEIASIARQYGASVPFLRSNRNSDDHATTIQVLHEVQDKFSKELNREFSAICCIYPTAPLIQETHLKDGMDLLLANDLDSVFPLVAFSYPIWRGVEIGDDNKTNVIWPEYLYSRSQDLKKVYHDAGQWYWYNPERLDNTLFTNNSASIVLDEAYVQDIDSLTDWMLAEIKYQILNA